MTDADVKKLRTVIKEEVASAVTEGLKPVNQRLDGLDMKVGGLSETVGGLDKKVGNLDQKVGSLDKKVGSLDKKVGSLDKKVGSLDKKVGSLDEKVNENTRRLGILWDQVERVTFGLENVQETLNSHTVILKRIETKVEDNSDDIRKVDKRLTKVEGRLGIVPPPELTIV